MEYCPLYVTISSSLREQWRTLRVVSCLSFLDLFPRSSRKSNDCFFGAASAISSLDIIEVSIAGKHFLYQNKSAVCCVENIICWQNEHKRLTYHFLVVCWETRISVVIIFAWRFSTIFTF